ncbi:phytanoyl-CoA dioxygenase family protein [Pseudokordiimonas caeni]|uniref:phytanoyl-CoA dioxygenase family protein n=1 Tax=Pseudokordiimonas caeni TaxID=2997908 RepID=UPI002811AB3E|nr:phytanoyl-CoA dioxygenase family protein [Pseudokordiimonas caeni]
MPRILKLHLWPGWLLGLLGEAKSFKANPILGARIPNLLGLHALRVLLSHAATNFRWFILRGRMPKELRARFHRDGFVAVEDFISAETVAAIRADLARGPGEPRQMVQGDTATQRILLDEETLAAAPALAATVTDKRFTDWLAYAGAKATSSILYVQRIRNGSLNGAADPQKVMHSDTFHPTMKAWLFLEDVTPEKGPFTYVRGSAALTWRRLKWEYRRSLVAAKLNDGYSEKGSFRANPEDLAELGLPAPEGLTVKAGTLVIGLTNGFHGRGQAEAGASRLEIWAYSRHNPFNPLPGLPVAAYAKAQNAALKAWWRHQDKKAAARGRRATWHRITAAEMFDNL